MSEGKSASWRSRVCDEQKPVSQRSLPILPSLLIPLKLSHRQIISLANHLIGKSPHRQIISLANHLIGKSSHWQIISLANCQIVKLANLPIILYLCRKILFV